MAAKALVAGLVLLWILSLAFFFGRISVSTSGKPVKKDLGATKQADTAVEKNVNVEHKKRHTIDPSRIEIMSWSPRVQVFRNILTDEECDYIIEKGKSHLERSTVVGNDKDAAKGSKSKIRSSFGCFLTFLENDPVIERIEKRLSLWAKFPPENGEILYLLRYEQSQQYVAHVDFFGEDGKIKIGPAGDRLMSIVMYLASPEEGGETAFPKAGIKVKAHRGDAVLFYNYHPNGTTDSNALHAGLPVIKGTKWAMTKWVRKRQFKHKFAEI
mmetsp:Transcript_23112/g.25668  ORF Transcript_23112/g.25668 Transcript_23112/m.25668 type:complete len:270 (+) Transcript_23112:43-852(+)